MSKINDDWKTIFSRIHVTTNHHIPNIFISRYKIVLNNGDTIELENEQDFLDQISTLKSECKENPIKNTVYTIDKHETIRIIDSQANETFENIFSSIE